VWRTLIASTLFAAMLTACTTGDGSPRSVPNPSLSQPDTATRVPRTKGHIAHGVSSFVSGWNSGNSAVLKEALARTAYLTMSTPRQGASAPDTGTSVTSIGWHQILPFAQRQHEAGQRLSYERIRVVRKRGAYGVGMRASYPDGSSQRYIGSKFAYSCDEGTLVRVVLIANTPAR